MIASGEIKGTRRARGLGLLRQVYAELYAQLGDEYSPLDLLRAAQALIDVTKSEYTSKSYQDGLHHPGYYSHAVDTMIGYQPWCLLENEQRCDNLGDERLEADFNVKQRLSSLYNPDRYYHRG